MPTAPLVEPRIPRVHVDAVPLHHPAQRLRRVDEREVDEPRTALARMRLEAAGLDPGRHSLWGLLLEEALRRNPLAIALHRERPVAQVRKDRGRNRLVVREEVALRDAVVREEDAV